MVSKKPRKQRKDLYNAPIHVRQRRMASPLHPELRARYGRRTAVVRKGDLVKVTRGGAAGHVGKVVRIDTMKHRITVEKMTQIKADGKQVEQWVDPSNVVIVKLDLTDKWRRNKFGSVAETDYQDDEEDEMEDEEESE